MLVTDIKSHMKTPMMQQTIPRQPDMFSLLKEFGTEFVVRFLPYRTDNVNGMKNGGKDSPPIIQREAKK